MLKSTVEEYFSSPRVSNSFLGQLHNPRIIYLKENGLLKDDSEKKHFRIGSALDCLLTTPTRWNFEFYISNADRMSDMMVKFIKALPPGITKESPKSDYQRAYEESGYSIKLDRVIKNFWDNSDFYDYYLAYHINTNRTVLTQNEYSTVLSAKEVIEENEYTKKYFVAPSSDVEIWKQVAIYFEHKELECKALLDGVYIDHEKKEIWPYDLKTIGKGVNMFTDSYVRYGYYRQAAFYTLALKKHIQDLKPIIDLTEYKLMPFRFIVVNSNPKIHFPAIIFVTTENDIRVGLEGGILKETNKEVKGINELIDLYKWHKENDKWLLPKEVYDSEGEVILDLFKSTNGK